MVIIAAWCLVPGHPGFIFKDNATLAGRTETTYDEHKTSNNTSREAVV